jgi:hypothetical protein
LARFILSTLPRVLVAVGKVIIITLPDVLERDNYDNVKDRVSPCAQGCARKVIIITFLVSPCA